VSQSGTALGTALEQARATLADARFPLALASAGAASRSAGRIVKQLDDYLIPRVQRIDAPLLAVVGGSTGAGKSTLVNSLVEAPVSAVSVLRPTTRAPVLVHHPDDARWFTERRILPGLTRTSNARTDHLSLQVLPVAGLRPGLALLDAPDIDSVVDANRELADQLLAAADLWLFVTTAARYADAVPWSVLHTARDRGTVLALVLDRVPLGAGDEIAAHLREMLTERGLGDTPLFVLGESILDDSGLLPADVVAPLRDWLARLASDEAARAAVIRTTLAGALRSVVIDVEELAKAADEQHHVRNALDIAARAPYDAAYQEVDDVVQDGALLRGEVLARWQEFVGAGDLMRALQARIGRLRDTVVTAFTGREPPGRDLRQALAAGLSAVIQANLAAAAEQASTAWLTNPAGRELVTDELARPAPDLAARTEQLIRDWQRAVMDLVREHGASKRRLARRSAYTINATGLLVMIAVFASTSFIPTGAEVGVAAGTTLAAQKLLEALFGDDALRQLARIARDDLLGRVRILLDTDAARFTAVPALNSVEPDLGGRLRAVARTVANAAPPLGHPR
jgi:hypothetical protein